MQPDGGRNNWQPEPGNGTQTDQGQSQNQPQQPAVASPAPQEDTFDNDSEYQPLPFEQREPIYWSAAEYIENEKNALWFVVFVLVVAGLIAVDIFFLKSWTFSVLVVVMAIAVVIFARRPARELKYTLSPAQGLYINDRLYNFDEFRAFGVFQEDGRNSIELIPTKRFALGLTVYFPPEAGEQIVDILGERLPMEEVKRDFIDIIVRKLHL